MGPLKKLTPETENMGIAFGILALGGTEPEIHLEGHLPPPPIATYVLKIPFNTRVNPIRVWWAWSFHGTLNNLFLVVPS